MQLISLHGAGIDGIPVGNDLFSGVSYYGDDLFGDDVTIPSNALNFLGGSTVQLDGSDFAFLGKKSSLAKKTWKVTKKAGTATKKGVKTTARVTTKVALAPVKAVAKLSTMAYNATVKPMIRKSGSALVKSLGSNIVNKSARDSAINKASLAIATASAGLTGVGAVAIAPVAKLGLTKILDEAVKNYMKAGKKVMAKAVATGKSPVQAKVLAKKVAVQASAQTAENTDVSPQAIVEEKAKNNTMLYAGIGLGVVALFAFAGKK